MSIKLEESEVATLKECLVAKNEIYAKIREMQHYAENFAIGIYAEQKKIEEKHKVDLASEKWKLDLSTNTIEEVAQVVTPESKIIV